jgi:hypothetical protein
MGENGRRQKMARTKMNIDYRFLSIAVGFYEIRGYKYLEVPWFVSQESCDVTCPPWAELFKTFAGCLVASGEQSFIEMRKKLAPGKYQCVTPCFRDEEKPDELHLQYFMKNELIRVLPPGQNVEFEVESIIVEACDFFSSTMNIFGKTGSEMRVVETNIGKDIEINGIEVGSYGYREYDNFRWVYGTGCAEPRLSQALK